MLGQGIAGFCGFEEALGLHRLDQLGEGEGFLMYVGNISLLFLRTRSSMASSTAEDDMGTKFPR